MAISVASLASAGSNTDASSYDTASISPGSNTTLLATIWVKGVDLPPNPTCSGNGLTWTQIDEQHGTAVKLISFRASGGSPSAGAVTFDFGGDTQHGASWRILEITSTDVTTNNGVVQGVGGTTGTDSLSITLAAFGSTSNGTIGIFGAA